MESEIKMSYNRYYFNAKIKSKEQKMAHILESANLKKKYIYKNHEEICIDSWISFQHLLMYKNYNKNY